MCRASTGLGFHSPVQHSGSAHWAARRPAERWCDVPNILAGNGVTKEIAMTNVFVTEVIITPETIKAKNLNLVAEAFKHDRVVAWCPGDI